MTDYGKWQEDPVLMRPSAGDAASPASEDLLGKDPFWDTWRAYVAVAAIGLGAIGSVTVLSIGVPLVIAAHLLLVAAVCLRQGSWAARTRFACSLLMWIWWPITLAASVGAGPVLLAWAAYRRFLVRRGRFYGPARPKPIIAAAVAAGIVSFFAFCWLLVG